MYIQLDDAKIKATSLTHSKHCDWMFPPPAFFSVFNASRSTIDAVLQSKPKCNNKKFTCTWPACNSSPHRRCVGAKCPMLSFLTNLLRSPSTRATLLRTGSRGRNLWTAIHALLRLIKNATGRDACYNGLRASASSSTRQETMPLVLFGIRQLHDNWWA